MPEKDYYKTLGVERTATKEEIKSAYKRLAKEYHPDLNKSPDATEKFKEINEAASVLGDDVKRDKYDKYGTASAQSGGFDAKNFGFDFGSQGFDFEDIFERFFAGESRGGVRGERRRGNDLRYDIEIELEESAFGATKEITIPRLEKCEKCNGTGAETKSDIITCPECKGTGMLKRTQRTPFGYFSTTTTCRKCNGSGRAIENECRECDGTGVVRMSRKIEVEIPAGAEDGTNLRIRNQGDSNGGIAGDLYIVIHQKKHKIFERHENDIYIKVPISFTTAVLGGEIEVPTLKGKAVLKIPSGTKSNTIFRMKSNGIPYLHGGGVGSQNVEIVIDIPEKLTKKQKELLNEFDKESKKKGWMW